MPSSPETQALSSADDEPLPAFLARIRAMSSAGHKPRDGGVIDSAWSSHKHLAAYGRVRGPSLLTPAERSEKFNPRKYVGRP